MRYELSKKEIRKIKSISRIGKSSNKTQLLISTFDNLFNYHFAQIS